MADPVVGNRKEDKEGKGDIRRTALPPLHIGRGRNLKIIYRSRTSKPGRFRLPRGLVVSPNKEIFVVDQGNRVVQIYSLDGVYLRYFPTLVPGSKDKDMEPHDVSMDNNDTLWVVGGGQWADYVVQYSTGGVAMTHFDFLNSWPIFLRQVKPTADVTEENKPGTDLALHRRITWPYRGIAVDRRNNRILVTDGLHLKVHVYCQDSSLVQTFEHPWPGAEMSYITVDEKGNVLVTDYIDHTIYKFDEFGGFMTKFGGEGSGEGQLNHPCGIYTDGWAHNIVADSGNNRLQIFTNDGQFIRSIVTGFSVDGVAMGPGEHLVLTSQLSHSMTVCVLPKHDYLQGCCCEHCKAEWISMILFVLFGKDDNEAWMSMILFMLFGKDDG